MKSFGLTDKGKVRAENQDSFLLELCPEKECLIAALCDGMGGARAGGVASALSIKTFVGRVFEKLVSGKSKAVDYRQVLQSACSETNEAVYTCAHGNEDYQGMGTTLVGGVIKDNGNGYIINVGDSRAYLLQPKKNRVRQITRDHSLVAELIRFGAITREQAKKHPQRHVITRALGTEPKMDSDYFSFRLSAGELLLLCSDGLSNLLTDEELLEQSQACAEPEELCRRLMDMALEKGAHDNVTVVVVAR